MVSSVGWTVAVVDDETRSTRSPEPRAGDEKEAEAMMNEKEKRGKGRHSRFDGGGRGGCYATQHTSV
jgi:hypothetical protein